MIKRLFLVFFISLSACGYQPLYTYNISENKFSEIVLNGDMEISERIRNSSLILEDKSNKNLDKLTINTDYKIEETSKNSQGQIESYKSILNINLLISTKDKIKDNINFTKNFDYQNKSNKFELKNYQNDIKNNLINEVVKEIIIFLNSK
jgi:hypothetical protein